MISDRNNYTREFSRSQSLHFMHHFSMAWEKKNNQVDLGALKSYHTICGVQCNNTWIPPSLHISASQQLFPAKTGASLNKIHRSKTDICYLDSTLTTKPLENFTEQQVAIMETLLKNRAGNKLSHKFLNSMAPKNWSHWGLPLRSAERQTPWVCRLSISHSICKTTWEDFTPTDIYIDTATLQSYL